MREYRHTGGSCPCFRVACYAPSSFVGADALPFVRAGLGGWPTAVAPATFENLSCGSCGLPLGASDVSGHVTTLPISTVGERRRPDTRLTRALLLDARSDRGCMTPKMLADYLVVDPRVVTGAMESGAISHAFRVGRRGGVGEWRCPWADGRAYIARLEACATDPAA
jgi:hypothetical protein